MAEENKAKNTYQVNLKFIRGEEFCDVIMCTCIKAPFFKKASFWMLKVNVTSILAEQLLNEISTKTIKQFRLIIYEIKIDPQTLEAEEMSLVHYREYKAIHAINAMGGYKVNMDDQNTELIITLVDFVFFDLFTKQKFNRKITNEYDKDGKLIYKNTAFNAINDKYRNFLKNKYKSDTFYFNNIGVDEDKSNYQYEEILLTPENDIQITDILTYNKKAINYPSFYFFDDFYLDKDVDAPITCHFISLKDNTRFKEFDINKFFDTLYASTLIKEVPINDHFYKIIQGQDSLITRKNNMTSDRVVNSSTPIFHPTVEESEKSEYVVNSEENREANVHKINIDGLKHENKTSVEIEKPLIFYTQDTDELMKERLKNYRLFIEAGVKQFVTVQTQDCFCEWLQFGRAYNFDITEDKKTKYLYTPIAIENIFYKDANDHTTKHISKAIMLEYYDNENKSCIDCNYYDLGEKYCVLHSVAKESESWCYDYIIPEDIE